MGKDNSSMGFILAFAAGILVGTNWDKIKENLTPLVSSLTKEASKVAEKGSKFVAEQKEKIEDNIIANKIASAKKNMKMDETTDSADIIVKKKKSSKSENKGVSKQKKAK